MSHFLTPLIVEQLGDGIRWKISSDLQYVDDALGLIVAEIGFVTDGGSIPGFFQGLINPYGKGFRAFVIHDKLYATQNFSRTDCDDCLRRALRVCGENILDSEVQFNAVRFGGEVAWKEDQVTYGLKKTTQGVLWQKR